MTSCETSRRGTSPSKLIPTPEERIPDMEISDDLVYALVRCLKGIGTGSLHDFGFRVWNAAEKRGLIRWEEYRYVPVGR